jgi:hypothetical protein
MQRTGLEGLAGEFVPLRGNPNQARAVANRFNCNIESRISHAFLLGCSAFS